MAKDNILGTDKIRVSFGYGTPVQAANAPAGTIGFGRDAETGYAGIWTNGHLFTGSVVDIVISDSDANGVQTVTITYLDNDGLTRTDNVKVFDDDLIQRIISGRTPTPGGKIYTGDNLYIEVDNENNVISLKYSDLYDKIKADLAFEGIGDSSTINKEQSEHILAIEKSYVKDASLIAGEDKNTLNLTVTKKDTSVSDPVVTNISVDVPNNAYIENTVNAAKAEVNENIQALDSSVADAIGTVNGRIDGVVADTEDGINSVKETVDELALDVSSNKIDADEKFGLVNGRVEAAEGNIETLEGKVETLEGQAENFVDSTEYETKISEIEGNISDIETSVQTLDTSVNEKINEVAVTASGQVDNLRGELSAVDDEIKGRVDTLEETSAQQSDVDDINNKIGEIDSSVNMIESDVINIKKSLGEGWINVADLLDE